MFYKLENPFIHPVDDWMKFKNEILKFKYDSLSTSLEYYSIEHFDLFKKQHIKRPYTIIPNKVRWAEIVGPGMLYPHKDYHTTAVLNYYISGGEDITIFYKPKAGNEEGLVYPGKEGGNVYLPESVEEVGRFVAKPGDAFLLDVTQIHSLVKVSPEPRMFINYVWTEASYADVLADIKNVAKIQQ